MGKFWKFLIFLAPAALLLGPPLQLAAGAGSRQDGWGRGLCEMERTILRWARGTNLPERIEGCFIPLFLANGFLLERKRLLVSGGKTKPRGRRVER